MMAAVTVSARDTNTYKDTSIWDNHNKSTWKLVGGVLHAERVLKHVEGTDDICYDVLAAKAEKLY